MAEKLSLEDKVQIIFMFGRPGATNRSTAQEFKDAITNECQKITPEALRNVKRSYVKRIDACIAENGAQFEHLL